LVGLRLYSMSQQKKSYQRDGQVERWGLEVVFEPEKRVFYYKERLLTNLIIIIDEVILFHSGDNWICLCEREGNFSFDVFFVSLSDLLSSFLVGLIDMQLLRHNRRKSYALSKIIVFPWQMVLLGRGCLSILVVCGVRGCPSRKTTSLPLVILCWLFGIKFSPGLMRCWFYPKTSLVCFKVCACFRQKGRLWFGTLLFGLFGELEM